MGILEQIKQDDERQQTTETLEALTLKQHSVEQQLTKLTKGVADLGGFMKMMDEQLDTRLSLLTSQSRELPSTLPDDETKKSLSEIGKTVSSVAQLLTSTKTVKLRSGEIVKQSDLAAYSMMQKIDKQLVTMSRASAELADSVNARGRIVIDPDKLAEHAVRVLDARLVKVVDERLGELEHRVASIGAEQAAAAAQRAEQITANAEAVVRAVSAAERRVDALAARVTWVAAGRLGLALLPLAAVLLVVGGLTMGAFHALGIGPLLGWAWSSFAAAEAWSAKTLIALGALGGTGLFGWVTWRFSLKLSNVLRGW